MSAAYRGCAKLSTHILCLLRDGDVVTSSAGAICGRAGAGAVTGTVHAHDVAAFTHAAGRGLRDGGSSATREHHAGGQRDQRHEQGANGGARRGRPFEKPRRDGADRGRADHSPPAGLNVHGVQWRQAGCQTRRRHRPSQDLRATASRPSSSCTVSRCYVCMSGGRRIGGSTVIQGGSRGGSIGALPLSGSIRAGIRHHTPAREGGCRRVSIVKTAAMEWRPQASSGVRFGNACAP